MVRVEIDTSVLDDGIDNVNFFNGRVLTAEDLRDEQRAGAAHRRRIGRAIGAGIVSGLDVGVGADGRSVSVAPGLAIAPLGDVLELADPGVEVALVVRGEDGAVGPESPFAPCETQPSAEVLSGDGIYLLVIAQAAAARGRAAAVGFGAGGVAADCGPRYTVEGVVFRLVAVDVGDLAARSGLDQAAVSDLTASVESPARPRMRNVLAHLLLDSAIERAADGAPLDTPPLGALDELRRAGTLTGCDVPIGLVSWSNGAIEFLDGWAVKRRPVPPTAGPQWQAYTGSRRPALRAAALTQFQEQLAEITASASIAAARATRRLRFLPAAGLLPGDIDPEEFFDGVPYHFEDGLYPERLEALVRGSLAYRPIDLASGEVVRLQVLDTEQSAVVAFSSSHLPREARIRLELVAITPVRAVAVGEVIQLRGRGFTSGEESVASVSFGDVGATVQSASDRLLEVEVPDTDPGSAGELTLVRVGLNSESDAAVIRVLPSGELAGSLEVKHALSLPAERLTYSVVSHLNQTVDITVGAELDIDGRVFDPNIIRSRVLEGVTPGEERELAMPANLRAFFALLKSAQRRAVLRVTATAEGIEDTDELVAKDES